MIFTQFAVNAFVIIALSSPSWGRAVSTQEPERARIYSSKEEASSVLEDGRDSLDPDSDPLAGMNDDTDVRKLDKKSSKKEEKKKKDMHQTKQNRGRKKNKNNFKHNHTEEPTDEPSDPPTSDVDVTEDPAYVPTPAEPLKTFRDIDEADFKWVNKSNIKAGETTCGFLKPKFGTEPDVKYPINKIEVYMCVQFAKNQPASKGNLVVHCGGPGSLSNCWRGSAASIGEENVANYNVITIDQRGMGRSTPSFYHEKCSAPGSIATDADGKYDQPGLQKYLDGLKKYVASCWRCTDCDFRYTVTQPDGTDRTFHFLEHSGTRQLADDLDQFRLLVKAPKLSLYGISYGTGVMGTYATIFPDKVDKLILDGSQSPYNSVDIQAQLWGAGKSFRYNYLKYTCWAANTAVPDSCPLEPDELVNCITNVGKLMNEVVKNKRPEGGFTEEDQEAIAEYFVGNEELYNITLIAKEKYDERPIDFLLQLLTDKDPKKMKNVCADPRWEQFITLLAKLKSVNQKRSLETTEQLDWNSPEYDQPSAEDNYNRDQQASVGLLVNGQDEAGGVSAYNDDKFITQVLAFQKDYGHEFMEPVDTYARHGLAVNYYWPRNHPLPILGNPNVKGMITGQLYDYTTPYTQTSQMRENFPSATVLTSQGIEHGLQEGTKGKCQRYVVKYLETGVINYRDGTVCGDPFPFFEDKISRK